MTELVTRMGQRGAVEEMVRVAEASRPLIADIVAEEFVMNNDIDLKSDTTAARNYEVGTIAQLAMLKGNFPDDAQITENLAVLLKAYDRLIETSQGGEIGLPEPLHYGVEQAMEDLFLEQAELEVMLEIWEAKKNFILQGARSFKRPACSRLSAAAMGSSSPNLATSVSKSVTIAPGRSATVAWVTSSGSSRCLFKCRLSSKMHCRKLAFACEGKRPGQRILLTKSRSSRSCAMPSIGNKARAWRLGISISAPQSSYTRNRPNSKTYSGPVWCE